MILMMTRVIHLRTRIYVTRVRMLMGGRTLVFQICIKSGKRKKEMRQSLLLLLGLQWIRVYECLNVLAYGK